MNNAVKQKADEFNSSRRTKKRWQRIIALMSAVVIIATTYVVSLPAHTQDSVFCGQAEHIHSIEAGCYDENGALICAREEHTHTLLCYSDPQADLETAEEWEKSVEGAEGVLAIAQTQLGYTESESNYNVADDGTVMGYTRYGECFGEPYAEWNGLFAGFCLKYAGVGEEFLPQSSDTALWLNSLRDTDAFTEPSAGDLPQKGALLFYEKDEAVRTAIVSDIIEEAEDVGLEVIEGDVNGAVETAVYSLSESPVFGYAFFEEPAEEETENIEETPEEVAEAQTATADEVMIEEAAEEEPTDEEPAVPRTKNTALAETGTDTHPLDGKTFAIMTQARGATSTDNFYAVLDQVNTVAGGNAFPVGSALTVRDRVLLNWNRERDGRAESKTYSYDGDTIINKGYCPDPSVVMWTFVAVNGEPNTYYIKNKEGKYLYFSGEVRADGSVNARKATLSNTPIKTVISGGSSRVALWQQSSNGKWFGLNMDNSYKLIQGWGNTDAITTSLRYFRLVERYEIKKVDTVDVPGMNIKMFNYDARINTVSDWAQELPYRINNNGYFLSVDGYIERHVGDKKTVYNPSKQPKLDAEGYPLTYYGSMKYLFDDNADYYSAKYTNIQNGGGLFLKDSDGFYYFDSYYNSAYYNRDNNRFDVYNYHHSSPNLGDVVSADGFYPFNSVDYDAINISSDDNTVVAIKSLQPKDLGFGMSFDVDFYMSADGTINGNDIIFNFSGDDNVYVYIDDYLVLDISGSGGYINFRTGDTTNDASNVSTNLRTLSQIFPSSFLDSSGTTFKPYSKHKLKLFYLESWGGGSYFNMRFNLPTNISATTVTNSTSGSTLTPNKGYGYTVIDSNGNPITDTINYTVIDTETGATIGTDSTSNGKFSLKANQKAVLELTQGVNYRISADVDDMIDTTTWSANGTLGTGTTTSVFDVDPANPCEITFNNVLVTKSFTLKNKIYSYDSDAVSFPFTVAVKSGSTVMTPESSWTLPDGTVTNADGTMTVTLAHNGEAVFSGLPYGAAVEVTEGDYGDYTVSYRLDGAAAVTGDKATATLTEDREVAYTNNLDVANVSVLITALNGGDDEFSFTMTVKDGDGNPIIIDSGTGYSVDATTGEITFSGSNGDAVTVTGVPIGTTVQISEHDYDGYFVTIQEDSVALVNADAYSYTVSSNRTLEFVNNAGVELPMTGASGGNIFLIGGIALFAAAAVIFLLRRKSVD